MGGLRKLIEEAGVLLATAEIRCGHTHPEVFAKLSEIRDVILAPPPTPDKGLVTLEILRGAMDEAWDFDCYIRETLANALNAALAPLIEREVAKARLEEAKWWHTTLMVEMPHAENEPQFICCERLIEIACLAGEQTT